MADDPTNAQRGDLWDAWREARRQNPLLTTEQFWHAFGPASVEQREELDWMLSLEASGPASSLLQALGTPREDGSVSFAGYTLLDVLGQGSTGIVYLAQPQATSGETRPVALKVLNPLLSASPTQRDQILREARLASQLRHEHIVAVIASGVERGHAWIAMEYAAGPTLAQWLRNPATAPERERRACRIGLQLAQAMQHAHAQRIVHRDLKPANIVIQDGDVAKVLDFGLARTLGTAFSVSYSGEVVGTPLYMAPEQARGEREIGPATDIYALGILLLEIASGSSVDTQIPLHQWIYRLARGDGHLNSPHFRHISPGVKSVIRRCLEAHPLDRYPSAQLLAEDLTRLSQRQPPRYGGLSSTERWKRRAQRHPGLVALSLLGTLALSSFAALAWWWAPMPVTFTTVDDGKRIWINGEYIGISTARVNLRPGVHKYRAQFMESEFVFEGEFSVAPREPTRIVKMLNSWYGIPVSPQFPTSKQTPTYAWVVVATPLPKIQLTINGERYDSQPGITSFLLPFGRHSVEIHADGMRSRREELSIESQDMCFLPYELDPIDSPWTTHILYSPFDYRLRGDLVQSAGLRMHAEKESLDVADRLFVRKVYLGPNRDESDGSITVRIPIPSDAVDLVIERPPFDSAYASALALDGDIAILCRLGTQLDRWQVLEGGRTWDESTRVPSLSSFPSLDMWKVPHGSYAALLAELPHQPFLYLNTLLRGAEAGEDNAYVYAFCTNALPERLSDGRLLWQPAWRLRFRHAEPPK